MTVALYTIFIYLCFFVGVLAIMTGLLYLLLFLIGKLLKVLGYYKMFYKTMMRMAQEGEFRKKEK